MAALIGLGGYMLTGSEASAGAAAKAPEAAQAQQEAPEVEEEVAAVPTGPGSLGPLVRLETFIVNLNEPGGNRYLKVGLELELKRNVAIDVIEKARPLLRHRTIAYLSNLSYAQTQGLVAKERIRLDLLNRFNGALGASAVKAIYFTDFLIQ